MPSIRNKPTRILVFGTFDILHPGHLHFFRQAKKLARRPVLIVSLARDVNVKKIKGQKPRNTERKRLAEVKKCPLVDEAHYGAPKDYLGHIVRLRPDIIALGYDQSAYTGGLAERLSAKGLNVRIVRLKAHQPHRYKTSLLAPEVRKPGR